MSNRGDLRNYCNGKMVMPRRSGWCGRRRKENRWHFEGVKVSAYLLIVIVSDGSMEMCMKNFSLGLYRFSARSSFLFSSHARRLLSKHMLGFSSVKVGFCRYSSSHLLHARFSVCINMNNREGDEEIDFYRRHASLYVIPPAAIKTTCGVRQCAIVTV